MRELPGHSRKNRWISVLPACLFGLLALGASAAETGSSLKLPLSEVMKSESIGLSYGDLSVVDRERLRKNAESFLRYHRGKLSKVKRKGWLEQCASEAGQNVFCEYALLKQAMPQGELRAEVPAPDNVDREPASALRVEMFTRGDLSAFSSASEGQIIRSLKVFPIWDGLQDIAEKAISIDSCPSPALLTALGLKSEEFFPDRKHRDLSIALYAKAIECGGFDQTAKARYRLSLLYVWDGQCQKAESNLFNLSEERTGDYVSRALYWRAHCAKVMGNKLLYSAMKGRLAKEFPMNYHTLLLDHGPGATASERTASQTGRLLSMDEPMVMFRSKTSPELNTWMRAIEVLGALNAPEVQQKFLRIIDDRVDAAEPGFRLYFAVLQNRSGDTIGQFKTLVGIFRDAPTMISRATLELFYPLRKFEIVRRFGSKVDPYLVSSLIRQESAFNERAKSHAGAMGLMQLMPATARRMERVSKRELFDSKTNVRLGVRYFKGLLARFENDGEMALAAYNAGPEKVDDWKRRYTTANRVLFLDLIPYRETREYVAIISRNYFWYLNLYARDLFEEKIRFGGRRLASKQDEVRFSLFSQI